MLQVLCRLQILAEGDGRWDFGVDGTVYVQLTVDSATTSKIRPYIALANKEFELWMKLDAWANVDATIIIINPASPYYLPLLLLGDLRYTERKTLSECRHQMAQHI